MRIGIDIDGVLTDMEKFLADYGSKYCIENNLPVNIKGIEYDEFKTFNWTEEQGIKFWNEYIIYYATKYPARAFASEVIKKLKEEGHEIYITTARNDYGVPKEYIGKMRGEIVAKWLEENEISYDKIIYTEGSKLPYVVGNYIELMIEDSPENIKEVSSKIPTFCYNCLYNKDVEGENITRVYSWYEIYDKIKEMFK